MAVAKEDVLEQVAAAEKLAEGAAGLQPWWTPIATKALGDALRDVHSILAARGFTTAQIQAWIGYDSALLNQALYWVFAESSALLANVPEEAKNPDRFDMTKRLATATVTDSAGDRTQGSAIGTGKIAGGWADANAREYDPNRLGFVDPSTGRLRKW